MDYNTIEGLTFSQLEELYNEHLEIAGSIWTVQCTNGISNYNFHNCYYTTSRSCVYTVDYSTGCAWAAGSVCGTGVYAYACAISSD